MKIIQCNKNGVISDIVGKKKGGQMFEKIKKNYNEWHSHSLGMVILTICVVLNGYVEISFALYGLAMVLLGIGCFME